MQQTHKKKHLIHMKTRKMTKKNQLLQLQMTMTMTRTRTITRKTRKTKKTKNQEKLNKKKFRILRH